MTLGDASRLRSAGVLLLIAAAPACATTDSVAARERSTLADAPEALRAEVTADPQPRLWAGTSTTCTVLGEERSLWCWGGDLDGELRVGSDYEPSHCPASEDDSVSCSSTPLELGYRGVVHVFISSGVCIAQRDGAVTCWGLERSAMPENSRVTSESPWKRERPNLHGALQLARNGGTLCGLFADGRVRCPRDGRDHYGPRMGHPVVTVMSAELHGCALLASGEVRCYGFIYWTGGAARQGPPCSGRCAELTAPVTVPGISAVQIGTGGERTCALSGDGSVYCWGVWGHVDNVTESMKCPERVLGLPPARSIAGGYGHACAQTDDGVYCWGPRDFDPSSGKTGNPEVEPVKVEGVPRLLEMAGGLHHMCGITEDRQVVCWGRNNYGQLGNGTLETSERPVRVQLPGPVSPR